MATANASGASTTPQAILKRVLFLGPTGAGMLIFENPITLIVFVFSGKSKMLNCCYNRSIEEYMLETPAGVSDPRRIIGTTSSISNYIDQRNKIIYVDTIGYGDVRFHQNQESFLLFFREFICYSSIGFNWIFLFIRFAQINQDLLTYIQSLEGILGEKAFTRCTIVFTHCTVSKMTLEKCIEANKQQDEIVRILKKVNNVIFGDLDTDEIVADSSSDSDGEQTNDSIRKKQIKKRKKFMDQMIAHIDHIDNATLTLQKNWLIYYKTKFTTFIANLWERITGKSSELSKLYKLAAECKKDIPVTIYYDECSICLELIVEIVDHNPKACITKCGHIFHYECLKQAFDEQKKCPNCRKDLRSLPEKMTGLVIGLRQVQDPLKSNVD